MIRPRSLGGVASAVLAVAVAGCASGSAASRPTPFPNVPAPAWDARPWPGPSVVSRALALRGTRYTLGGDRPSSGFDCSGLVRYVFLEAHVELPRTVEDQFRSGTPVETARARAGDLIFFSTTGGAPSHVGIVVDASTFVHAPGSGGVVRAERFDSPYWNARLRGIRRIADAAHPAESAARH